MKKALLLSMVLVCFSTSLFAVNFGSRNSALKISSGAILNVTSTDLTFDVDGTIVKDPAGSIMGNQINFSNGILEIGGSEVLMTAVLDPDDPASVDGIKLIGNSSVDAEPGTVIPNVTISGVNNRIEGQPLFRNVLNFLSSTATLTVAIQSALNQNINLNGGTLRLEDNLRLADAVLLVGPGTVILEDNQLAIGGKNTTWATNIYWNEATDMVLNSKVNLNEQWTFDGESHISGNGNIIDFDTNGFIFVRSGTTLYLSDIKLKDFETGKIICEDQTAQVRLSNVDIQMSNNCTFTQGGMYVEGPTTIVTRSYLLTFDNSATLTVDNVTLWYDVLNTEDNDNIRPEVTFDAGDPDRHSTHISFLNGAMIRLAGGEGEGTGEEIGDAYYYADRTFTTNMYLSADRMLYVQEDITIDGNNHFIQFARESGTLITVADGKTLVLTNIVLKDFSPDHFSLGAGAQVIFGDGVTIELAKDETLTSNYVFRGTCRVNGQGNCLTFGAGGKLIAQGPDANLEIENIILEDVDNSDIVCHYNSGTLKFAGDVFMLLSGNYTLSMGKFLIRNGGILNVAGDNHAFIYSTSETSTIDHFGTLFLDRNVTFSYDPPARNNLLWMVDDNAVLFMNGATLSVSDLVGLVLKIGALVLDHKNFIYNNNGVNPVQFGDGVASANNLNIEIMPAGSIDLREGMLSFANV